MKSVKIVVSLVMIGLALAGCSTVRPEQLSITTEQREFVYEYTAPAKSQKDLFRDARNYFAMAYGNSKDVSRVEDEGQGTIIGKAVAPWNFSIDSTILPFVPCASNYNIIFIAKDGKARLQLTLLDGAAITSCAWPLPPKQDYPQIVRQFQKISAGLGAAIDGQSDLDRLKQF